MAGKRMDISFRERILLSRIRKRPPMYVKEYSLARLRSFFDGYRSALLTNGLDGQRRIIPKEFDEFVLRKYELYPSTMGYINAILQQVPDGKEAIELFFQTLDEFLETNRLEKIQ